MKTVLTFILTLFLAGLATAQTNPIIKKLTGTVKDSVLNYNLPSATIALYNSKDSMVVGYSLSNKFGEFSLDNTHQGESFYAIFSYVGYASKEVNIKFKNSDINLGTINLSKSVVSLTEVVIKPPPIRLNRDTLEFFADAYTLEKSATVEDLIRKLTGLTIWGDGSITFNGKAINSLTVNGKPFFGGDIKVATQNLPKDIIEKIQIYNKSDGKQLGSELEMNIKLKKNLSSGLFGKIGTGYGTGKSHASDIALNYFTDKIQLAGISALNNVNKVAFDTQTLQRNATFRSRGINNGYASNFGITGENKQFANGVQFQYDFLERKRNNDDQNILIANYFNSNKDVVIQRELEEERFNQNGLNTNKSSRYESRLDHLNEDYFVNYKYNNGYSKLNVTSSISMNKMTSSSTESNLLTLSDSLRQSSSNKRYIANTNNKEYKIGGDFSLFNQHDGKRKIVLGNFDVGFNIGAKSYKANDENKVNFYSNTGENMAYNRRYEWSSEERQQTFSFNVYPLKKLFGTLIKKSVFSLNDNISFDQANKNALVTDYDAYTNSFMRNEYLSVLLKHSKINNFFEVRFSKNYDLGSLFGRYDKKLDILTNIKHQVQIQRIRSTAIFQNLNRNYTALLPSGSLTYSFRNHKGRSNTYSLSYRSSMIMPEIQQISPLVDSADVYNLYFGNSHLREAQHNNISLAINHYPFDLTKGISYVFNFSLENIRNHISESIEYDEAGRRRLSYVNLHGYRVITANANVKRIFKFGDNQFQLAGNASLRYLLTPSIFTAVRTVAKARNMNLGIQCEYTFSDQLFVSLNSSATKYNSKLTNDIARIYANTFFSNKASTNLNVFRGLSINSSFDHQKTNYSFSSNEALIWNAALIQRFTENRNIELKLEALDLLNESQRFNIFSDGLVMRSNRTNTLKQYFMVSLAYYPRIFKKTK